MRQVKFWQIKPEIRILGIDDGPFEAGHRGKVPLVGAIFRGGKWLDGVMITEVEKDGMDVTERLSEMLARSRHLGQLRVLMVEGVTFAGFNVLDVNEVFRKTGLPVVVVSREVPVMADIRKALKNLPKWKKRWEIIKAVGKIYPVKTQTRGKPIYMQPVGIKREDEERIVRLSSTHSSLPEPLRVAHLIATAIVRGESHGRA
ncbi:MAG: endonuclease dU [Candidatus Hadarchaeaceae archaeon]